MSTRTRQTGIVGQPVELQFNITLNGQSYADFLTEGGTVDKWEIYPTQLDAENNTNRIELIPSGSITPLSGSNFKCTVNAAGLTNAQTYYDKFYFTPPPAFGQPQESHINFFVVRAADFAGSPLDAPKRVLIFGWVDRDMTEDDAGVPIKIQLNHDHKYNDTINKIDVKKEKVILTSDEFRYWEQTLVITDYLEADAHYIIQVGKKRYLKKVPNTLTQATNMQELPDYV